MKQFVLLSTLLLGWICLAMLSEQAAAVTYPSSLYPDPVSAGSPRLYIRNRLTELKTLWADNSHPATQVFKHELNKLLGYASASGDWRWQSGWPAAALALAYQLSGNKTYANKAISTYIPAFTGVPTVSGRLQSITHYALAYDWLFGVSGFNEASLRDLLIKWSNAEAASDDNVASPSYIGDDSDHLTAATTSHLAAGLAIYGQDTTNAIKMLDRGWRGWVVGFNNNPSVLTNISIEEMFGATLNGHGLPGWDYFWMSDGWDLQYSWGMLAELGYNFDTVYADARIKKFFPRAIVNFIHAIDPKKTIFHWMGDCQSDVRLDPDLSTTLTEIRDWFTTNIYFSTLYGYDQEAAWGKFFLQDLATVWQTTGSADPLQQFVHAYSMSDPVTDYTSDAAFPRFLVDGIGNDQKMGYGYFRTAWSPTSTWGGIAGVGNYFVDHMHNSAGSFFLWRNGEWLITDPHSYGGQLYGNIYSNLGIPNGDRYSWYLSNMDFATSHGYDFGGPPPFWNEGNYPDQRYWPGHIENGFVSGNEDLIYVGVNLDHNYNVIYTDQWHTACGTQNPNPCGQPVIHYKRHFLYDGSDYAMTIDRVFLRSSNWTSYRLRNQNPNTAPTKINNNLFSIPSDKGNYRTLVRILQPTVQTLTFFDETASWGNQVPSYSIDDTMYGFEIKAFSAAATTHTWLTVLHMGAAGASNTILDSAATVMDGSGAPVGIQANDVVFVTSPTGDYAAGYTYTTPAGTPANARHLIADLTSGCFDVSVGGNSLGKYNVYDNDNTIYLSNAGSGSQTFVVSSSTGCSATTTTRPVTQASSTTTRAVSSTTTGTGTNTGTTTRTATRTSSGGGGGSSSGCFSAEAEVLVLNPETEQVATKKLRDVVAGDLVESFTADLQREFSPVYFVAHQGEEKEHDMIELHYFVPSSGLRGSLQLTADHLLLVATKDDASHQLQAASAVQSGHSIWVFEADKARAATVIATEQTRGHIRAPLTVNHHIVVSRVAASVYAHSDTVYSLLSAPLRLLWSLAPALLQSAPVAAFLDGLVSLTDFFEACSWVSIPSLLSQ